ncbi:MAG: hypothetical protein IKQ35_00780 [Bacilli bacterium]|nr:hypothetical protein [Bacilli bacterium]
MNEEVKAALEEYPYLKGLNVLFVSREEFDAFESGEKVKVDYDLKFSKDLLRKILSNDYYYSYVEDLLANRESEFILTYPIFGDTGTTVRYSKKDLIFGLIDYVDSNQVSQEERERFDHLKSLVSLRSMKEKYKDYVFPIVIDGSLYEIKGEDLIAVLELDVDDFDNLCFNDDIREFRGMPKEQIIYAAGQFVKRTKINDSYILPEEINDRIDDILSNQIIDLESVNFQADRIDEQYEQIHVDDGLKKRILEGMDPNFTDLEKAIYIYIMMCKTLTYDEEYYAVGQKGPATEKHKQREYIEEINIDHNEVVCFEFDLIYSKLLHELGITFHLDSKSFDGEYGEAHADITFRCGKYMCLADSVTSILKGDMYNAKTGKKLVGLKCLNKNFTTQEEFNNQLRKVYSYIRERDTKRRPLDEIVAEYRETTDSITPIPFVERLEILLEKAREADFATMDDYSYIMDLRKIMFTEAERDNNVGLTILRDPNPRKGDKVAVPVILFTINEKSFYDEDVEDQYFLYRPHESLRKVSAVEVLDMLAYGKLDFIREEDSDKIEIPGITDTRGNRGGRR